MTRHIHADMMIQAANDTTILWDREAWQQGGGTVWIPTIPTWNEDCKYRQRPAAHPHQAMMDQAAADPSIQWQYKSLIDGDWCDCTVNRPSWQSAYQYRQKPAEVVMVDMWQWVQRNGKGDVWAANEFYATKEAADARTQHKIIGRIEGSKISVPMVSQ